MNKQVFAVLAMALIGMTSLVAAGVTLTGNGWTKARGTGFAHFEGSGQFSARTLVNYGAATVEVCDYAGDAVIEVNGFGNRIENSTTCKAYRGLGSIKATGSHLSVFIDTGVAGVLSEVTASGSGIAFFEGSGWETHGKIVGPQLVGNNELVA
jgi:hypothetical protein